MLVYYIKKIKRVTFTKIMNSNHFSFVRFFKRKFGKKKLNRNLHIKRQKNNRFFFHFVPYKVKLHKI